MKKTMLTGNKQSFFGTISYPKSSRPDWSDITQKIAEAGGMSVLDWAVHHFPIHGSTYIMFLGESHIALDLYPEANLAEITLVSCKQIDVLSILKYLDESKIDIKNYTVFKKGEYNRWEIV